MLTQHPNFQEYEPKWRSKWDELGLFAAASPQDTGEPFCITAPPPNVTGVLHMGHAFQFTLMDVLTRYHRQQGRAVRWQLGTDHAGIATQMMVEKHLASQGKPSRQAMGREAFEKQVWAWKESHESGIYAQLEKLGAAMDRSCEVFTLDQNSCDAVYQVFETLFDQGLIYRHQRLVNWDAKLQTVVSDLEVQHEEVQGHLYEIGYLVVAESKDKGAKEERLWVQTTRPETLLADSALAVHPEGKWAHYAGRSVRIPITGRVIPVIADDQVDPEFGTGCVKVTPAHDFNDYEMGLRHDLPMPSMLDQKGCLCGDLVPEAWLGIEVKEARKVVLEALEKDAALGQAVPHPHTAPISERSGQRIEPRLTPQWYVKIAPLATKAMAATDQGQIRFVPSLWQNQFDAWMREIQDWCISRQLWWGHRIPVYYDDKGKPYVGRSPEHAKARHHLDDNTPLTQDEDVLDTWFSSALWSFASLGWPGSSENQRFHPTNVLITGFDILFFWVARMIMMSLHIKGEVPFKALHLTGLIRDHEGQKMSKTKGNVIDPLDVVQGVSLPALIEKRVKGLEPKAAKLIEKATQKAFPEGIKPYGADTLRWSLLRSAVHGRDIRFELSRLESAHHFINKLWNAARFVLGKLSEHSAPLAPLKPTDPVNRWLWSRLDQAGHSLAQALADYRFDQASTALQSLVWEDYCDWFIELSKPLLAEDSDQKLKEETLWSATEGLHQILMLLNPMLPYVTEEIDAQLRPFLGLSPESCLASQSFKAPPSGYGLDEEALGAMNDKILMISAIRTLRGEHSVSFSVQLDALYQGSVSALALEGVPSLAKLKTLQPTQAAPSYPHSASRLREGLMLYVPLAQLTDLEKEKARLDKLQAQALKRLESTQRELQNESFVQRAPASLVEQKQSLLLELQSQLNHLDTQIKQLSIGEH